MTKPTKRKQSKLKIALLAPILMIAFMVGWTLTWTGKLRMQKTKQLQKPIAQTPAKQDEFELMMIPRLEEENIRAN
jgi:hypothetical protein